MYSISDPERGGTPAAVPALYLLRASGEPALMPCARQSRKALQSGLEEHQKKGMVPLTLIINVCCRLHKGDVSLAHSATVERASVGVVKGGCHDA